MLSMNLYRRQLSVSQRAMIGDDAEVLREKIEARAKERQRLSQGRGQKGVEDSSHLIDAGKTRDQIGATVGVSGCRLEQVAGRNSGPGIDGGGGRGKLTHGKSDSTWRHP